MSIAAIGHRKTSAHALGLRIESITDEKVIGWAQRGAEALVESGLTVTLDGLHYATFYPECLWLGSGDRKGRRFEIMLPKEKTRSSRPLVEVAMAATGEVLAGGSRYGSRTDRPQRALVLIPAGRRYDHDKVRLHRWPMQKLLNTYVNIGDLMVYDSTLKLLDFEDVEVANNQKIDQKEIDRYNAEFDFVFLRGSNFIHAGMRWKETAELIEKLKIPVFAIGVGAQAAQPEKIVLPPDAVRVWSALADHCGSIGVRGAYSADVLFDNGIRNVDVVGCPSMFRLRDSELKVNRKLPYDIRRIAFSLRRETGDGYSKDVRSYRQIQRDFMLRLDAESDMTVTIHGEREEKSFYFRDVEQVDAAIETLRKSEWITPDNERQMLDIYRSRLFFNTSVEQFDEFIKTVDLAIGYRVHAVLPALANGVPGILVGYDTRTSELAETHQIPMVNEQDLAGRSWRDLYRPELFNAFARHFPKSYRTMADFLTRNGIPHRM